LGSPLILNGWLFSTEALMPQFSRHESRLRHHPHVFDSRTGGVDQGLGKATIVGGVATWVIWSRRDDVLQLATLSITHGDSPNGLSGRGCFLAISVQCC